MNDAHERAEAAKKRLQATFRENPELQKAFKQSIEELRKPDNIKPIADSAVRLFEAIKAIQRG